MPKNTDSVYRMIGASNHTQSQRQPEDFYATNPRAVDLLLEVEHFSHNILEPACGMGHISRRLEEHGHRVFSYDLIPRGYGKTGVDFLKGTKTFNGDIVTNPPYSKALDFIKKSLEIINPGSKVACYLKLQFLEGRERKKFFLEYPPQNHICHEWKNGLWKRWDFYHH